MQVTRDQIRGTFTVSIDAGLRSAWATNAGRSKSDLKPIRVAGVQARVDARTDAHLQDAIAGLDAHPLDALHAARPTT
jgi:hypothetical protein